MIVFGDSFIVMLANRCGMAWPSPCEENSLWSDSRVCGSTYIFILVVVRHSGETVVPEMASRDPANVLAKENTAENAVGNAK